MNQQPNYDLLRAAKERREREQREENEMFDAIRQHGSPRCVGSEEIERDDRYGESGVTKLVVEAPYGISRDILNRWAAENYNSRCCHSYDCCGNIYGSIYGNKTRFLRRTDGAPRKNLWALEWHWHQNV
jgi:hypothetical protein